MDKTVDSLEGLKELQELWAKYKDNSGKSLTDELFDMRRAEVAKEDAEHKAWLASKNKRTK